MAIKTISGVAIADVKTFDGVAIANVKTVDGVAVSDVAVLAKALSVWPLDEVGGDPTSGIIIDVHGTNDGVNNGATEGEPALAANLGVCHKFNGNDDISIDSNVPITSGGFGFSCWVKLSNETVNQTFLRVNKIWWFKRRSGLDNKHTLNFNGVDHFGSLLAEATSIFLCVVFDGTDIRLYENAVKVLDEAATFSDSPEADEMGAAGGSQYNNGWMSQMVVFDVPPTQADIDFLYDGGDGVAYVNWV